MSSQQRPVLSAPLAPSWHGSHTAQCIILGPRRRPIHNKLFRALCATLGGSDAGRAEGPLRRAIYRRLRPLAAAAAKARTVVRARLTLTLNAAGDTVRLRVSCRPLAASPHRPAGSRCHIWLDAPPNQASPDPRVATADVKNVPTAAPQPPYQLGPLELGSIEQQPWAMGVLTPSGRPLMVNRAAQCLLGIQLHAFAQSIDPWVHPDEQMMLRGLWHEAVACRHPLQLFVRLKLASGTFVTCLVRADPCLDRQGRVSHWVCVCMETQGAQWLQASTAPGEPEQVSNSFLTVASHELRTPLTSLQLNLQLALQRLQRQRETPLGGCGIESMVSRSLKQTHRLIEVVSDILDASRLHVDKLQLRQSRVDLRQALLDTLQLFDRPFADVGCRITVQLEEDIFGFWDRGRVEQVFFDLLANVLKHAPGSHVLLTAVRDGDVAAITVSDDGPGIPQNLHEQIFGRFGRAAECRGISGLGLGLYLCRRIVEDHGGTLKVRSVAGDGSTFVVRLPLDGCGRQYAAAARDEALDVRSS